MGVRIGVTWIITFGGGGGVANSTMGITNFNLQRQEKTSYGESKPLMDKLIKQQNIINHIKALRSAGSVMYKECWTLQ
jgi:hypothetical protein